MKLNSTLCSIILLGTLFTGASQAEWLVKNYSHTDNLGNETITLEFSGLEEHSYVKLNWDLYIIDTWDGYDPQYTYATDYWGFSVDDEYQDWAFRINSNAEGDYSPDRSSEWYGEGDYFYDNSPVTSYKGRFRYYEDFNDGWMFEHSSDTLTLTFFAHGLQNNLQDESWALDRLYVATGSDEVQLASMGNLQDVNSPLSPLLFAAPLIWLPFMRKRRKS